MLAAERKLALIARWCDRCTKEYFGDQCETCYMDTEKPFDVAPTQWERKSPLGG